MKKELKVVGIVTGIVSAVALISLGCIYIKDIASNLIDVKRKIFSKE